MYLVIIEDEVKIPPKKAFICSTIEHRPMGLGELTVLVNYCEIEHPHIFSNEILKSIEVGFEIMKKAKSYECSPDNIKTVVEIRT